MAEWLKAHDSKSCGPKGLGGSNPLASANSKNKLEKRSFSSRLEEIKIESLLSYFY